jgi:hypothetical protein
LLCWQRVRLAGAVVNGWRPVKQTFLAVAVVLGVLRADAAWTAPITLTGTIDALPQAGVSTLVDMVVLGDGFAVTHSTFTDVEARALPCQRSVCRVGDVVRPTVPLHPFGPASGIVDGVEYGRLLLAADLFFDAGGLVLPEITGDTFIAIVPFTLTGHLLGYRDATTPLVRILDTDIVGRGLAELSLSVRLVDGATLFSNPTVRYTLEPPAPAPVPESSPLILFGIGLVTIGARALLSRARLPGAPIS